MLNTEKRNPATTHLDTMETTDMVEIIETENRNAAETVIRCKDELAAVIDAISPRMKAGGRLIYVGCGTSGRLGVMDAAECPPTFGVSSDLVVGMIAGGDRAMRTPIEGTEDSREAGIADLHAMSLRKEDTVVGISAAGGAAYVLGALDEAKQCGCLTVGITNNPDVPLALTADLAIVADTGAEPLTGSTRMKAGTAQKMILNTISTCCMVKLGYVYENMMINLRPANRKLHKRMVGIVDAILSCGDEKAETLLNEANWDIRAAVKLGGKAV